MTARGFPLLAAALTGIQVGAATVASRYAIAETTPAALALLRYVVGVLVLLPLVLAGPRPRFAPRDLLPIALLGITQFGIVVALLNYALQHIPAGRAALIFATFPLVTMLLAAAIGRERLAVAMSAGVALSILGVALALADRPGGVGGSSGMLGDLAAFASACSGAVCSVLYRPYLRRYDPLPVGALAMAASVAFLALPAAGEGFFSDLPQFSAGAWLAIGFIGCSSAVGYWCWLYALAHAPPTRVTAFLSLGPVTATGLGALVLGEQVTALFLAGLAAVAAGLWLATRAGPDAAQPRTRSDT